MPLYARLSIQHRPEKMSDHVRKRIGRAHSPEAHQKSRLKRTPAEDIDYAFETPDYLAVCFAPSTIQYQVVIEADPGDLTDAAEAFWRAVKRRRLWGPRTRLRRLTIVDSASNTGVLEATTGWGAIS